MSALDGWIDICRAGNWRDIAGREVAIDEARLDRIVAEHAAADPAPVVVGHPEADAPAYAWIESLRRVGDRLQATLRDIAPAFREAVEAGRYAGRSIALQGDTLRHLGFLGGRAPAVPGLAPTCFASAPETVIAFSDDDEAALAGQQPAAHPDSHRAAAPEENEADGRESTSSTAAKEGRAAEQPGARDRAPRREARSQASGASARRLRETNKREAALAARETALLAREAAAAADERRRAAEATVAPHVEAGRVLPAERAALVALLAALGDGHADTDDEGAAGGHATIAFASTSGGEERMQPAAILERFIEGLPRRVDYRTLAGGPVPAASAFAGTHEDAGEDSERIAAEARALMAAEAERGVTLTPAEAVDRARAKRGLGIEGGTQ